MLSFGDLSSTGNEADEWVETHTGRLAAHDSAANSGNIDDIPDLDGPAGDAHDITAGVGNLSVAAAPETPDLDDIPDMEEELEEGDDEATVAPIKPAADVIDARFVSMIQLQLLLNLSQPNRSCARQPTAISYLRCHDHLR